MNIYAHTLGMTLPETNPHAPRERDARAVELRRLMDEHQLTHARVAALLGRKPQTVAVWRVGGAKPIPQRMLDLLKTKLAPKVQK